MVLPDDVFNFPNVPTLEDLLLEPYHTHLQVVDTEFGLNLYDNVPLYLVNRAVDEYAVMSWNCRNPALAEQFEITVPDRRVYFGQDGVHWHFMTRRPSVTYEDGSISWLPRISIRSMQLSGFHYKYYMKVLKQIGNHVLEHQLNDANVAATLQFDAGGRMHSIEGFWRELCNSLVNPEMEDDIFNDFHDMNGLFRQTDQFFVDNIDNAKVFINYSDKRLGRMSERINTNYGLRDSGLPKDVISAIGDYFDPREIRAEEDINTGELYYLNMASESTHNFALERLKKMLVSWMNITHQWNEALMQARINWILRNTAVEDADTGEMMGYLESEWERKYYTDTDTL